jgi:hypothetical protein
MLVTRLKAALSPNEGMLDRLLWKKTAMSAPAGGRRLKASGWANLHSQRPISTLLVGTLIDFGNFSDPTLPFGMFQRQDFLVRPVKVISNVRYLLEEPL